jgi:hypothetical protein
LLLGFFGLWLDTTEAVCVAIGNKRPREKGYVYDLSLSFRMTVLETDVSVRAKSRGFKDVGDATGDPTYCIQQTR